jgi:hypothetical protein
VGDDEWHVLMGSILETINEVYGHTLDVRARRMIVLNAGTKKRRKEGKDVIKTGRHCVFPQVSS